MNIGKDIGIAEAMSDAVEGGASIAWRLLATLEGGSAVCLLSALLAYTARGRAARAPVTKQCSTVAITNSTSGLGKALKRRLEARGCVVSTVTSAATSGAESDKYDALVVVGAAPKANGLNGIADLVTEDVYSNIKLLECLSARVNSGGCIAWASAGAVETLGTFSSTAGAFDAVLQASLIHVAKVFDCVPIWVGRCESEERTAERVVSALMTCDTKYNASRFSIRNAAYIVGEYLDRWIKMFA